MGLFCGDTYINQRKSETIHHYDKVEITERRAPTDLSVKLLNEFEEKARNNIIAKVELRENNVNAALIYFYDDFCGDKVVFHIRFNLNGKEYNMRDSVDRFEWGQEVAKTFNGFGNSYVLEAFHKKLGEIIAFEMIKACPDFVSDVKKRHKY